MRQAIEQIYMGMSDATRVLLVLSIILFAGFLVSAILRSRLSRLA